MDANQQLTDLKGEIDAITKKIGEDTEEWKKASGDDKTFYRTSIQVLNARLEVLIADRSKLIAPAPGKNTPLAFDASAPPVYASVQSPPLVFFQCLVPFFLCQLFPNSSRMRVVNPSCEDDCVVMLVPRV